MVGGGDTAMEEATFLTRFARVVTVVHRRDELRASKVMQERAFANPKISFIWDSEVVGIQGEAHVTAVKLRNLKTGEETLSRPATAVRGDRPRLPRTELFRGVLELDDEGYIKVELADHAHQPPGRVRGRRRGGPQLPPGHHRGRHRLCRRAGRRAAPLGAGAPPARHRLSLALPSDTAGVRHRRCFTGNTTHPDTQRSTPWATSAK